ncbi:hypothetical protein PoB_001462900 [Plakobranchus ocellatus]|uniref:Uncharacterized protein n=1 Tax=Plakobranchus ocellatus TaxID=259542 RepID=A0AAV3YYM1_9GAST|nr:hypothetical protein PoB_001462900 [Plakobranchus ocellatus]
MDGVIDAVDPQGWSHDVLRYLHLMLLQFFDTSSNIHVILMQVDRVEGEQGVPNEFGGDESKGREDMREIRKTIRSIVVKAQSEG